MGEGGNDLPLEQTPTWAVALVCLGLVTISLIIERAIHHVGNWLSQRHRKALYEALEKLKSELMLLGFISLLLAVGEKPISKICITEAENSVMLPCKKRDEHPGNDHCSKEGKYPLISETGMNQLHIFIFTLAVIHVLFSGLIIALGRAKMKRWSAWEKEIETVDYQLSHDRKFDFHKYIRRSLDDDFKTVIGISPPLWAFAVAFLLVNVYRWSALFWISFIPAIIVLLVGLKLQLIIIEMASNIQDRQVIVKGTPVVQPTDKLFWFGRPELVLLLIHFTLFQNAFQLAFFLWIWWQFGLGSCFHENFYAVITRVVIGVAVQFMCSYITLPLYALVTQMGSHMKPTIFEEHIVNALMKWQQKAKKSSKRNRGSNSGISSSGIRSGETTPSGGSPALHLLHKYYSMGAIETTPSRGSSPLRLFNNSMGATEATPSGGSSPLHLMHHYNTMGDIQITNISPRSYHSEHTTATPSPGSSPSHLKSKYNSMGAIESPDRSPSYDHSEHSAAVTEVTKQHSILKRVKASHEEIVEIGESSVYPPGPTKTVRISNTSGNTQTPKQHLTLTDGNTSAREFSFPIP